MKVGGGRVAFAEDSKKAAKSSTKNSSSSTNYYEDSAQSKISDDDDIDYSAKTNIMLVSLTDFCPYFCHKEDLDGKQFKNIKKRELMSPVNMHYNVHNIIELEIPEKPREQIRNRLSNLLSPSAAGTGLS